MLSPTNICLSSSPNAAAEAIAGTGFRSALMARPPYPWRCYGSFLPMDAIFLTCCVRGLEVTRHFTPELGLTVAIMLAFALAVGGALYLLRPVLLSR